MTQVNLDVRLTDFQGNDIGDAGQTAAKICSIALNNGSMEEKEFKKKMECYELMRRIETAEGGVVDLKASEITLLQKYLAKTWPAMLVGRVNELLEPTAVE